VLFNDVACYDATHCIAAAQTPGGDGAAYLLDDTGWTQMPGLSTQSQGDQVSCASSSLCAYETIDDGQVSIWNGTTWSDVVTVAQNAQWRDNNIVCTGSSCVYDTGVGVYGYTAGTWQRAADSTYDLDGCASATLCLGDDAHGHIGSFDGSSWLRTAKQLARVGVPTSISCPSATFCALTDAAGNAYTYDGTAWSDGVKLADTSDEVSAVSCPESTFCLATFGDQTVAAYEDSTWTTQEQTHQPETSLRCMSAQLCLASGKHDTEQFDGHSWTVVATGGPWLSMSCPSATFCAAATPESIEFWDGTHWQTSLQDDHMQYADLHGISCPTSDFCLAVDGDGNAFTYRDGTWSDPQPTLIPESLSVSCYSATFCQTFGEYSRQTYDGHYWSAVTSFGDTEDLMGGALDCYGDSTCMVASGGSIWTSQPI
jgi:hypothetical protein